MQNSKNKTNLLFLFFFLLTFCHLSAQPLIKITSSNSNEASNAIVQKFPSHVQVSNAQIQNFFNNIFQGQSINPNIGMVRAQVFELNAPDIFFGWSPVNSGAIYHIDYLNLRTGYMNSVSTNDLSQAFNLLSRDMHLFAFYSDSPLGRSNSNIMLADLNLNIIIDKDIFSPFESIPNGCENPTALPITTNSTLIYSKSFEWSNTCTDSKYYITVEGSDINGDFSSSSYKVIYEEPTSVLIPPAIRIEPLYAWTPLYFFGKHDVFEIILSSDQFTVLFPSYSDGANSSVTAHKCSCGGVADPKDVASSVFPGVMKIKAYPNPTSSIVSLEYHLTQADDVSIYVADALLQNKVSLQQGFYQNSGTHQIEVDMQDFAPGIYHCIVQTATERKSIKLVKIE